MNIEKLTAHAHAVVRAVKPEVKPFAEMGEHEKNLIVERVRSRLTNRMPTGSGLEDAIFDVVVDELGGYL